MKTISRICLFGALTLVLLTAACAGQEGSPTAVGTIPGNEFTETPPVAETETTETAETGTASPEATLDMTATLDLSATIPAGTDTTQTAAADTSQTPGVPVTGVDLILLECQFCIEGMAHALLVLPDTATFETVADTASLSTPGPDMGCNTVDTFNGKQVVICRSEENTSLNLNICTDGNNCTQLLVELQDCPDQPGTTNTPEAGLPSNTPGSGGATNTPGVGATNTPAVGATDTPAVNGSPTSTP
jgi:hypothetical protein